MILSDLPDWALLAILAAIAALVIVLRAVFGRKAGQTPRSKWPDPGPRWWIKTPPRSATGSPAQPSSTQAGKSSGQSDKKCVLVDGSNVIHWRMNAGLDLAPSLGPLRDVIALLAAQDIDAGVIFDATAGHLLEGHFVGHDHFAALLPKAKDVLVVPKGTSADDYLIDMAMRNKLRIVSNDRFRDHPNAKRVIKQKGRIVNGKIELLPPRT